MYEIVAVSKDNQTFKVMLDCSIEDVQTTFYELINKKGWDYYQYKIKQINKVLK